MKKTYGKPLVYCENFANGDVFTNSVEYAEQVREKIEKIQKEIPLIMEETASNKEMG